MISTDFYKKTQQDSVDIHLFFLLTYQCDTVHLKMKMKLMRSLFLSHKLEITDYKLAINSSAGIGEEGEAVEQPCTFMKVSVVQCLMMVAIGLSVYG